MIRQAPYLTVRANANSLTVTFHDHFSDRAAQYARSRPGYPPELVDYLAEIAPEAERVWEAGCGSGQLTRVLAAAFRHVVASDPSVQQLVHARREHGVTYCCATAEASALANASVDLVVAAQAAHWFELQRFYQEARRVGRSGAVIALVSYGVTEVTPDVDVVIRDFHTRVLGSYWPPERKHVDAGYRTLEFPFAEIAAPSFNMRTEWALPDMLNYVGTWSAVRAMLQDGGEEKLEDFRDEIARAWPEGAILPVRWPLVVKVGRLP